MLFISDRLEQVLEQVDGAIKSALPTSNRQPLTILGVLSCLTKLENQNRPWRLTEMAYAWCALMLENRDLSDGWRNRLFLSLEIGFRHFDPLDSWPSGDLEHGESRRALAVEVFGNGGGEAIADLLCALTICREEEPLVRSLDICKHIVDFPSRTDITRPFSQRLRQLLLEVITYIGVNKFEAAGAEKFVGLVNSLGTEAEGKGLPDGWGLILLGVVQSSNARPHLAPQSWELLTSLVSNSLLWKQTSYTPGVADSISGYKKWDKLECWLAIVLALWHRRIDGDVDMENNLKHEMELLFRGHVAAVEGLRRRVVQLSVECGKGAFELFEKIRERAQQAIA